MPWQDFFLKSLVATEARGGTMARARQSNARKRSTTGPSLEPQGARATLMSVAISHGKSPYVRAAINAKADVLEWEYRYRRISPIAYAAGNTYHGILREAYSGELRAVSLEPSPHVSPDGWQGMLRMERAMRVNAVRQDAIKALGKKLWESSRRFLASGRLRARILAYGRLRRLRGSPTVARCNSAGISGRLSKIWPCIGRYQVAISRLIL
jgi:hypothetical protein